MFFWYFEARETPRNAPTTIYLAGGPGSSSAGDAVSDGGPCYINRDANSTTNNPWSMNSHVNMLYIDQPVSTGFSYTRPTNSTLDLLFLGLPITQTGITPFEAYGKNLPPQNSTFFYGTFSEQDPLKTANSTQTAAKTLWHFSQAWFTSFPEISTSHEGITIFGNSCAGYYIPVFAEYILQQNKKIASGKISGTALQIDTVGVSILDPNTPFFISRIC
jgi:carboxypeptidase C (cathepsin A)